MSDYDDSDIDNPDDEDAPQDGNALVRQLRQQLKDANKRAKTAGDFEAKATAAERKLALIEAGIDLSTPTGKLFAKAYDGETTAEAIRSAAEEYDLVKPAVPEPEAGELDAHQRIASASAGAPAEPDFEYLTALKNAKNPDEVMAAVARQGLPIKGLQ